jgi:hypothetical protein
LALLVCLSGFVREARADVVPPEAVACEGKKQGDACSVRDGNTGVCTMAQVQTQRGTISTLICDRKPAPDPKASGAPGSSATDSGASGCGRCALGPADVPTLGALFPMLVLGAVIARRALRRLSVGLSPPRERTAVG